MRLVFVICAFVTTTVRAQAPSDDSNIACVERLAIPTYPRVARAVSIDGTVKVKVQLASDASVLKVTTEVVSRFTGAKDLLAGPIEDQIRSVKFRSECGGKLVALVFQFELHGKGMPSPKETSEFSYPNTFRIISEPQLAQP